MADAPSVPSAPAVDNPNNDKSYKYRYIPVIVASVFFGTIIICLLSVWTHQCIRKRKNSHQTILPLHHVFPRSRPSRAPTAMPRAHLPRIRIRSLPVRDSEAVLFISEEDGRPGSHLRPVTNVDLADFRPFKSTGSVYSAVPLVVQQETFLRQRGASVVRLPGGRRALHRNNNSAETLPRYEEPLMSYDEVVEAERIVSQYDLATT
ncbi:hypothetical protein P280DRAFT_518875 [Massarina eburnea CBS 473.64]|uniref:Uncharacterized protein n=1 Tax=Massarina eburnea CBS 473.64 TaxID=1395130 RepID=A0A6A6RWC2_9PLEO|nr:hypothetical protein P280DRAFT_518875 [Massarina eburnea CBS 473.64]